MACPVGRLRALSVLLPCCHWVVLEASGAVQGLRLLRAECRSIRAVGVHSVLLAVCKCLLLSDQLCVACVVQLQGNRCSACVVCG